MNIAFNEALKWSISGTLVAGAGVALMAYRNKNFNRFTSLSIKLSIPTMTALGVFSYRYETVAISILKDGD